MKAFLQIISEIEGCKITDLRAEIYSNSDILISIFKSGKWVYLDNFQTFKLESIKIN